MVSSFNVEAVQRTTQKRVHGHVTTNSGRRILIQITFDVMSVRKPLLSTSALKRRGVTIIDISRLSCLLTHHSGEWNPASQSGGDGWRECGKRRG